MRLIITHSFISKVECATTEEKSLCLPADEGIPKEALSQMTQATPSKDLSAETPSNNKPASDHARVSHQGPENMEVEKKRAVPVVEQEASQALLKSPSNDMGIVEPLRKDLLKSPASLVFVNKTEPLPMDDKMERSPCQDPQSPSMLSLSADTQEVLSAVDMESRLIAPSEEEEDEEDDEPMKGHSVDIKEELQEVKPELLLDEMSNMSHGDESSSGFLGSPGEPDPQLSMELGLVPTGRSHTDNLLTETDDSLPFEPLRSDREKAKRRGSPGRSRIKQVPFMLTLFCFLLYYSKHYSVFFINISGPF